MCCVPTCRPVVDRCLDPVVIRGGGLTHTQAADTTKPTYGLPTFGFSRCSSIWGRLAGMTMSNRDSVTAATCKASSWLGECRLGVFEAKSWNLRASAGEGEGSLPQAWERAT